MPQVERVFLGWERCPTHTVAEHLLAIHTTPLADFTGHLLVIPTRQAGRRIREAMARLADSRGQAILGLETIMPSFLLKNHQKHVPLASAWQISSTWTDVLLDGAHKASLQGLFPSGFDAQPSHAWSLATGQAIQSMREQLCLAGLSITDVISRHPPVITNERARWDDLARVETDYIARLQQANVIDPVADRLATAKSPALPANIHSVTLACIPDLSPIASSTLNTLTTISPINIGILIAAEKTEESHFDDWGRPKTTTWTTRVINIPEWKERLIAVAGPEEQAACVPAILAKHTLPYGDVALGAPDASLIPFIAEALRPHGIAIHDPANRPFTEHPLFALVSAFLNTAQSRVMEDTVELLKHPDVLQHLKTKHAISPYELLCEMDEFLEEHRPLYLDVAMELLGARNKEKTEVSERPPYLQKALRLLSNFLPNNSTASITLCLRRFLETVFSDRELEADDETFLAVASLLDDVLHDTGEGKSKPQDSRTILGILSNLSYPVPNHDDAMIVEGWMELPWNDAPTLIVTSLNEGFVPLHRRHGLFLPDGIRAQLGMDCDATTLARDAYILTLLLESRKANGVSYVITARQGSDAEPLKPSRLLFNTVDDSERMARAAHSFGLSSTSGPLATIPPTPHRTVSFFLTPPLPTEISQPNHISISAINDYLSCPFHYYLRHVLHMNPVEPFQAEPSAAQFGQLVHQALHDMAKDSTLRTTCDAKVLELGLIELLSTIYRATFGEKISLAVKLSRDMAEQRLRNAVPAEIALRLDGWNILHTEYPVEAQLAGMIIKGRIDRIDQHDDGRILLTDYKTGKSNATPEGMHIKRARQESPNWHLHQSDPKKRWVNLQLPLYAWLIQHVIPTDTLPALCVFNLGPLQEDSGPKMWDTFNQDHLHAALHTAEAAISHILSQVFWPPAPGKHPTQILSQLFHDPPEAVIASSAQQWLAGIRK